MSVEMIRLSELSVHIRRDWIMAVCFRGTFDDSGDEDDPQHSAMSLGGYIGAVDSWDRFEGEWQKVLDRFSIPYLHMKEFRKPDGIYAHLLSNSAVQMQFFGTLGGVIRECDLFGFGSVVRVRDLKKFNDEFGLKIEGYSLALADCLGNISMNYPGIQMDMRLDRGPSKPYKKIKVALEYLAADKMHPELYPNVEDYIGVAISEGIHFSECSLNTGG